MASRNADATWQGDLKAGKGTMKLGSGAWEGPFTFATRFEGAKGANPEELVGAALAGCYSMALSAGLGQAKFTPTSIRTSAKVHLEKVPDGFGITRIELTCFAEVPGIAEPEFQRIAEETKKGCPVSKALQAVAIELKASLKA